MSAVKTNRQSNFELLRILAMLMIVAHHFSVHGHFDFSGAAVSINEVWLSALAMGGKLGVNLFVLISGYFLCTRTKLDLLKVGKLHSQIWLYSIGIYTLMVLLGNPFSLKACVKSAFPITFEAWWFASTYFVLFLFSPYINRTLAGLTKKQHAVLLLMMFVFWSVIPAVTHQTFQRSNLTWFVFLYVLAAYFRKYEADFSASAVKWLIASITLALLMLIWVVATDFFGLLPFVSSNQAGQLYSMFSVPMVLLSCLLFLSFKNLKMPYTPWINQIAASTFGVYLIHDSGYIRTLLWVDLFRNASFAQSPYLIAYSLACIVAVFVVCTLLDRLRMLIFGKWLDQLLNMLLAKACAIGGAVFKRFTKTA